MRPATLTTWFKPGASVPAISESSVVIGGTHLLNEFIRSIGGLGAPLSLTVVAPFLDASSVEYLCSMVAEQANTVDLQVVTSPGAAALTAVKTLQGLKWRSCVVRSVRGLHSKVYLARSAAASSALIGSHNLTNAGRRTNFEVGVLLVGRNPEVRAVIEDIQQSVAELTPRADLVYDSLHQFNHSAAA